MFNLKTQQIHSNYIRTVPPNRNMDESYQGQLYVVLSLLFPIIALILFAIARTMQIKINSRSYKYEENIESHVLHKKLGQSRVNEIYKN